MKLKSVLTIAGSDSSGGAGIQADLKAMSANGVFSTSVITALTAQNTTGVTAIQEATGDFVKAQLDAVFTDIYPDSVKIGMLSSVKIIKVIAERLRFYKAKNIVLDPVMVATSGAKLIQDDAISSLCSLLFPLAVLITPNIPEAEILANMTIKTKEDIEDCANALFEKFGCNVLIKGGHNVNDANDCLCTKSGKRWFLGKRIDNPNTHGTGCTLSSAIASNLAKGESVETAVERSKKYLETCLAAMLDLGRGSGPMWHFANIKSEFV